MKNIEQKIIVEGMSCKGCLNKVERSLKQIDGVKSVKGDLETGNIVLKVKNIIDVSILKEAIENAGYSLKV